MATVISNNKLNTHSVDKYKFKVLALGSSTEKEPKLKSHLEEDTTQPVRPVKAIENNSEIDSSAMSNNSKDALIESLMKKTNDMADKFVNLQMKLEDKELEYKQEIEKAKLEAFNEGVEAGKAESVKNSDLSHSNGITQFSTSVATLENSAKEYERALEGIKGELITAALDIAKEVVSVELNTSSNDIAKVLSSDLIKELQGASKITLKVNPKDHGYISEHVGSLEHVEVISDSAVSLGGVIAISDAGNIDAQISKRFERVKRAALSE